MSWQGFLSFLFLNAAWKLRFLSDANTPGFSKITATDAPPEFLEKPYTECKALDPFGVLASYSSSCMQSLLSGSKVQVVLIISFNLRPLAEAIQCGIHQGVQKMLGAFDRASRDQRTQLIGRCAPPYQSC